MLTFYKRGERAARMRKRTKRLKSAKKEQNFLSSINLLTVYVLLEEEVPVNGPGRDRRRNCLYCNS